VLAVVAGAVIAAWELWRRDEQLPPPEPMVCADIGVELGQRCDAPPPWARVKDKLPPDKTKEEVEYEIQASLAESYLFINKGARGLKDVEVEITVMGENGVKHTSKKRWPDWESEKLHSVSFGKWGDGLKDTHGSTSMARRAWPENRS
jgi:hypothetical protein